MGENHQKRQEQNKPLWGVAFLSAFWLRFPFVPRTAHDRKILGETIRKFRKAAKLSQEKLAEKANLHPVYVGKIERGEKWISLHALIRVAAALKVPVSDLVAHL